MKTTHRRYLYLDLINRKVKFVLVPQFNVIPDIVLFLLLSRSSSFQGVSGRYELSGAWGNIRAASLSPMRDNRLGPSEGAGPF
jgi:hypothetical protein